MSAKDWQAHARHVLDAMDRLRQIQARGDMTQDLILYDAALRNLQTLSEATQHLPKVQKQAHAHIPWRQITAFRNILVHNYLGHIDPLTVRAVIDGHLPALETAVRAMLQDGAAP